MERERKEKMDTNGEDKEVRERWGKREIVK